MHSVSVIIPVFNAGPFLEECVGSVLNQTFTDFDVCLVDDGSTDGSGRLCDTLSARDGRVRTIHLDANRGVSAARNRGMEETDGTWVCFIDGDDWVAPTYLQDLTEAVEDGECDLAVSGQCSARPGGRARVTELRPMELEPGAGCEDEWVRLFRSFLLFGPVVKLYRRELLDRYSIRFPEDVSYGEDLMFNMAYLKRIRRLRTVGGSGYFYRRSAEGTLSTRFVPEKFAWTVRQFRMVRDYFRNCGLKGDAAGEYLASRWWGLAYDSLFEIYRFRKHRGAAARLRAVRAIVKTPENDLLPSHADVFRCPRWIKFCLFHRLPFCLFLLLEAAYAGKKHV